MCVIVGRMHMTDACGSGPDNSWMHLTAGWMCETVGWIYVTVRSPDACI